MKIKSVLGWEDSYLMFEVDNANSSYCYGDMIWCGDDEECTTGEMLIVHETVSREDIEEWSREIDLHPSQRRVLLGMLTQSGLFD